MPSDRLLAENPLAGASKNCGAIRGRTIIAAVLDEVAFCGGERGCAKRVSYESVLSLGMSCRTPTRRVWRRAVAILRPSGEVRTACQPAP